MVSVEVGGGGGCVSVGGGWAVVSVVSTVLGGRVAVDAVVSTDDGGSEVVPVVAEVADVPNVAELCGDVGAAVVPVVAKRATVGSGPSGAKSGDVTLGRSTPDVGGRVLVTSATVDEGKTSVSTLSEGPRS